MYTYQDLIDFFRFNPAIQQALRDNSNDPEGWDSFKTETLAGQLSMGFTWRGSPQGDAFWRDIHTKLRALENIKMPVSTAIPVDNEQVSTDIARELSEERMYYDEE